MERMIEHDDTDVSILCRREYTVQRLLCLVKGSVAEKVFPAVESCSFLEELASRVCGNDRLYEVLKPHSTLLVDTFHCSLSASPRLRVPQCQVLKRLVEVFCTSQTYEAFLVVCKHLSFNGALLVHDCECGQGKSHWERISASIHQLLLSQPYLHLFRVRFSLGQLLALCIERCADNATARWHAVRALCLFYSYDIDLASTRSLSLENSVFGPLLLHDKVPLQNAPLTSSADVGACWKEGVHSILQRLRICAVGTATRNVEETMAALELEGPVLVKGPPGSGKSTLIRELCRAVRGRDRLVELQIDDQMDSKTLFGTYICTDTPGEFKWNPGALTRAVQQGDWLLIENVDRVPLEVLAALAPLFEENRLRLPGHEEDVFPAFGFRVFGTVTCQSSATTRSAVGRVAAFLNSFIAVTVQKATTTELKAILKWKFKNLNKAVVDKMLATYASLQSRSGMEGFELSLGTRIFTTRDLFNWASRVSHRVKFSGRHSDENTGLAAVLTEREKIAVLVEGLECITAAMPSLEERINLAEWLALSWGIDENALQVRLTTEKPIISLGPRVAVGRILTSGVFGTAVEYSDEERDAFAYPGSTARLLELLCSSVVLGEPVLLVGETGTGKTSTVQHLAKLMKKRLVVQNMHIQCDTTDLLGGYKPARLRAVASRLYNDFLDLFGATFPAQSNSIYLETALKALSSKKWKKLLKVFLKALSTVKQLRNSSGSVRGDSRKRRKSLNAELVERWQVFEAEVERFQKLCEQVKNSFVFDFEEGALVEAVRKGHWILLDEINLAAAETLQRISSLLEEDGTLFLTERGDVSMMKKHKDFRLFAAMNPSTDFGKKDLPEGLRQKFTEVFVDEIVNLDDLRTVVVKYMDGYADPPVAAILECYTTIRRLTGDTLLDGTGQTPHYSLRTLCRAMSTANTFARLGFGLNRGLYESFLMSFGTVLNTPSYDVIHELIKGFFVQQFTLKQLSSPPSRPGGKKTADVYSLCGRFWLKRGEEVIVKESKVIQNFVLTPSADRNLNNVARAVAASNYPILLQGPTSSGKTTLVRYLAAVTGNSCLRINNHEHTDLQEYMGRYVSDSDGRLCFKEGILVEAVRQGKWIILDELNLAPSEVLEALNRLLDDNRELFIPETQETIKPHPGFHLFATQNPAGEYGGRKILSRAFRNRFLELHVDDLPREELETILNKRTQLAPPFCRVLVDVMKDLQVRRQRERLFAGKDGFITPRELLRWAGRNPLTYAEVALQGYRLLADRVRREEDRRIVQDVLEKHCRVSLEESELYDTEPGEHALSMNLVWTKSLRRLFSLVDYSIKNKEPVLLVGETGCGKTTVCELHAIRRGKAIRILNCHQNTETGDFIGSLRPVRHRSRVEETLREYLLKICERKELSDMTTTQLVDIATSGGSTVSDDLRVLLRCWRSIFEWEDGPLVRAMKDGTYFMLDELSLAEDAVLERLNSVLEPDRRIFLAEKGGDEVEELEASEGFRLLATMNPGGDYGKRELSPALRNRFTEIWIPELTQKEDLELIVEKHLSDDQSLRIMVKPMVYFFEWFNNNTVRPESVPKLSLRDLIAWAAFMVTVKLKPYEAMIEGARLVLLDGLGIGTGASRDVCAKLIEQSYSELQNLCVTDFIEQIVKPPCEETPSCFGIPPYMIEKGSSALPVAKREVKRYSFKSVGIQRNLFRILRGLQLSKPILLEGSPGVGKTSLVSALAASSGHRLVRINLSEQTDFADLIGSDMPSPASTGDRGQEFTWNDGLFLSALKAGDWVLLDEINLASQSVLEGLNSVLDYRASIFIPEINESFSCPPTFRIFAAQNPVYQGGGRKGLPKSFLNRFTKVYMDALSREDYLTIVRETYPSMSLAMIEVMIDFVEVMSEAVQSGRLGSTGSPWEFNLRDVFRWCDLVKADLQNPDPAKHVGLLFIDRLRTEEDRCSVKRLFEQVCEQNDAARIMRVEVVSQYPGVKELGVLPSEVRLGEHSIVSCDTRSLLTTHIPCSLLPMLENLVTCVEKGWPVLLTGHSASGKTSCLQTLAHLYGRQLVVLPVTPSTDSTDLIGCFEQVDSKKQVEVLKSRFFHTLRNAVGSSLKQELSLDRVREVQVIEALQGESCNVSELRQLLTNRLVRASSQHGKLVNLLEAIDEETKRESRAPRFIWVDGLLVKALEAGEWVVLDGASLCSPTVLDRLNPILEENGELVINECGVIGGRPRTVRAHPDFRIFLVSNPEFGEVSRAMRNRCVELSLINPSLDDPTVQRDLRTRLRIANQPNLSHLVMHYKELTADQDDKLEVLRVLQWSKRFSSYSSCGFGWREALERSYTAVYERDIPKELATLTPTESSIAGKKYLDPWVDFVLARDSVLLRLTREEKKYVETGILAFLDAASPDDWKLRIAQLEEQGFVTTAQVEALQDCFLAAQLQRNGRDPFLPLQALWWPKVTGLGVSQDLEMESITARLQLRLALLRSSPVAEHSIRFGSELHSFQDSLITMVSHVLASGVHSFGPLASLENFHRLVTLTKLIRHGRSGAAVEEEEYEWCVLLGCCCQIMLTLVEAMDEAHSKVLKQAVRTVRLLTSIEQQMTSKQLIAGLTELCSLLSKEYPELAAQLKIRPASTTRTMVQKQAEVRLVGSMRQLGLFTAWKKLKDVAGPQTVRQSGFEQGRAVRVEDLVVKNMSFLSSSATKRYELIQLGCSLLHSNERELVDELTSQSPETQVIEKLMEGKGHKLARAVDEWYKVDGIIKTSESELPSILQPSSRWHISQIHPVVDAAVLRLEQASIVLLLQGDVDGLRKSVSRWFSIAVELSSRALVDLVWYKSLLMRLDQESMVTHLCKVMVGYFLQLWRDNTEQQMPLVEGILEQTATYAQTVPAQQVARESRSSVTDYLCGGKIGTELLCRVPGNAGARTPVVTIWNRQAKADQLNCLLAHLVCVEPQSRKEDFWANDKAMLLCLVRTTMIARLKEDNRSALEALLAGTSDLGLSSDWKEEDGNIPKVLAKVSKLLAKDSMVEKKSTQACLWVMIGMFQMYASLPGDVDRAAEVAVMGEVNSNQTTELDLETAAWKERHAQNAFIYGAFQLPEVLSAYRKRLDAASAEHKRSMIYRPEKAAFRSLRSQMQQFMTTLASPQRLFRLLDEPQLQFLQSEESWRLASRGVVSGLLTEFEAYDDVTYPFCLGINMISHGLRLLALSRTVASEATRLDNILTSFPSALHVTSCRSSTTQSHVLCAAILSTMSSGKANADMLLSMLAKLASVGGTSPSECDVWRRMEEKILGDDNFSGYEERQNEEGKIEFVLRQRVDEEESFREMFPDYHRDFNVSITEENAVMEESSSAVDEAAEPTLGKIDVQPFARIFLQTFRGESKSESLRAFARCLCSVATCKGSGEILALALALQDCGQNVKNEADEEAVRSNLYTSPCIKEVVLLETLLVDLLSRLEEVLVVWPENAVLLKIRILTLRLLELPLSTPLMRALVGIESLCRLLNDWETGASRHVSLDAQIKPLSGLIKRWRRLEVKSWEHLLDAEEVRCRENAERLWFDLLKVLGEPCSPDQCATLLHSFMRTSPRGEYDTRLEMIDALSKRFHAYKVPIGLQRTVFNIHAYYAQWSAVVGAQRRAEKQPIETKLKEFAKLAKWDDRNYFSLKESSEKSHRQLHKLCKSYMELLARPAYLIVQQACNTGVATAGDNLVDVESSSLQVDTDALDVKTSFVDKATQEEASALSLSKIAKRADKLLDRFHAWRSSFRENMRIPLSLHDVIVGRIKSLRQNIKAMNPKQRALSDLFMEMKAQGVFRYKGTHKLSVDPMKQLTKLQSIQSITSKTSFNLTKAYAQMDTRIQGVISQLHMLHVSIDSRSSDLTKAQVDGCTKLCRSFFGMLLEQRTSLACALTTSAMLEPVMGDVRVLCEEGPVLALTDKRVDLFKDCVQCGKSLELWCQEVKILEEACGRLPSCSKTKGSLLERGAIRCADNLDKAYTDLTKRSTDVPQLKQLGTKLTEALDNGLRGRRVVSLVDFNGRIRALNDTLEEVLKLLSCVEKNALLEKSAIEMKAVVASIVSRLQDVAVVDYEFALSAPSSVPVEDMVSSLQLCVQYMASTATEEKSPKILDTHIALTGLASGVSERLARFVERCSSLGDQVVDESLSSSMKSVYFMLKGVASATEDVVHELSQFHLRLLQLEQLLVRVTRTLVSQGFCRPPEENGEEQGAEEEVGDAQGGTGMGEGKGEKDVSKEIEDEEQLLGLDGEDALSEKSGEEQDADDGIEMSNDFEGETFDLSEDDGESEEEEEGKEELDREMGDLDEEKEEVVDEKLWDANSEDEDESSQSEDESFEKDAPMQGENKEDQLRTKEDDEKPDADPKEERDEGNQGLDESNGEEENEAQDEEKIEENHHIDANDSDVEEAQAQEDEEGNEEEEEDGVLDYNKEVQEREGEEDDGEPVAEEENPTDAETEAEQEDEDEEAQDDPMEEDETKEAVALEEEEPEDETQEVADSTSANLEDTCDIRNDDGGDGGVGSGQGVDEDEEEEQEDIDKEGSKGAEDAEKSEKQLPGQRTESEAMDIEPQSGKDSTKTEVNPWRDPGAANEAWHRRLKLLEAQDDNENVPKSPPGDEGEEAKGMFEYAKEDMATTQVLGEAAEDEKMIEGDEDREMDDRETALDEADAENDLKRKEAASPDEEEGNKPSKRTKRQAAEESTGQPEHELEELNEQGSAESAEPTVAEEASGGTKVLSFAKDVKVEEEDTGVELVEAALSAPSIEVPREESLEKFWSQLVLETSDGATRLCEQLRLILEATSANKLQGDYRTGKRLNLKRIIPYIASQYRKDKIWLRRMKRDKRDYHIVLAIDNSKSMKSCGYLAMKTFATISKALTKLETGKLCVTSFGTDVEVLHSLEDPFSDSSAAKTISHFRFEQDQTFIETAIESTIAMLDRARQDLSYSPVNYRQLAIFISDGKFDTSKRNRIARAVRAALRHEQFVLLIIVESDEHESIMETKKVSFVDGNVKVVNYMDDYPFPYYAVVSNMKALPQVVSDALRQWFELVRQQ